MAEAQSKRQREETHIEDFEGSKRHKSYNHILSILEDEEDEPTQDLSAIFTTLQQELSSDFTTFDPLLPCPNSDPDPDIQTSDSPNSDFSPTSHPHAKEDEEDEKERVIRHLLEASDDELGIPHRVDGGDDDVDGGDRTFSFGDGLWEFEDEAANYYTLLQSELFM